MAITIVTQPQLYQPAGNPIIFNLKSDNTLYFVYFLVQVLATDNSVIATQKYYSLPNYIAGSVFDLSSIVSNYVDYQLINTANIVEATPNIVYSYKLKITEYVQETVTNGSTVTPTGNIIPAATISTATYNVWNGTVPFTQFSTFNYLKYVINNTATLGKFLTDKPLINNVYKNSTEYLYLVTNMPAYQVRFRFYGKNAVLLGQQIIALKADKGQRLNVSPGVLSAYFGTTFNTLYGDQFQNMFTSPFGEYSDLLSANYYTVELLNETVNGKSDIRYFIMKNVNCRIKSYQLLFSNALGGFDTVTLFNPRESVQSTKTSIKNYQYNVNSSGQFTNINNGVFNDSSTVINSNNISTYKGVTDVLNDAQAQWLRNIIIADKVYLMTVDGLLLPVTLTTTSYNILQKRYNKTNNRLELEFSSSQQGLFDLI